MAMRDNFLICSLALLLGCQSPDMARDHERIMRGLQKRVTTEEARRIVLGDLDSSIEQGRALNTDESRKEAELLTRLRRSRSSKLDSFLARRHKGDEIWEYRTYVTPDGRGGESGLAIIRNGAVVEHMLMLIYD